MSSFCGGDNDECLAEQNERLRAANDILLGQASDDYLIAYGLGCVDGWRYAQETLRAIIAIGVWARRADSLRVAREYVGQGCACMGECLCA